MFDPNCIRGDFPILHSTVNGNRLIYFDNAATTQKPRCVIDRVSGYYERENSNIHRGMHFLSRQATGFFEMARETIRCYIGAESASGILFTKGTTESINLVAYSFAGKVLKPGDNIIVSCLEHHSNLLPWQAACKRAGAYLRLIPLDSAGALDMDAFESMMDKNTQLVAVAFASNVTGAKTDLKKVISLAHERDIPVLVDGAQSLQHGRVSVSELGCDFFCFSGHKTFAPTGAGVLYGKRMHLESMEPFLYGGEMMDRVSEQGSTYAELPYRFEAGTPDISGVLGLAEAIKYIEVLDPVQIAEYEAALTSHVIEILKTIKHCNVLSPDVKRLPIVSFTVDGVSHDDLCSRLDMAGIAVRGGELCAQLAMKSLGVECVVRASLAMYNTFEEAECFCDALRSIIKSMQL